MAENYPAQVREFRTEPTPALKVVRATGNNPVERWINASEEQVAEAEKLSKEGKYVMAEVQTDPGKSPPQIARVYPFDE